MSTGKGYGLLVILINAKLVLAPGMLATRYGLLVILINAKRRYLMYPLSQGYGLLVILINAKLNHINTHHPNDTDSW